MILLDTNVVSELMKPAPEPVVMAWINAIPGATVLLSAVSQAEILLWRSPRAGRKAWDGSPGRRTHLNPRRRFACNSEAAEAFAALAAGRRQVGRPIHRRTRRLPQSPDPAVRPLPPATCLTLRG